MVIRLRKERKMSGKRVIFLLVGFAALFLVRASLAQTTSNYPNRPIEIILPTSPGGGLDFTLNLLKNRVEKLLGQPMVYIYKPGAGGATGTVYAKGCKTDGYTLVGSTISTLVICPLTMKGADYSMADFTPICSITTNPIVICVKEDSPYKTMQDFIQIAKTKGMKYATPGALTSPHILMEAMGRMAGFKATHIPHSGALAGMAAVLGGHIDALVSSSPGVVGPGKLRIIAIVNIEDKRMEDYPNIPTLKELGFPFTYAPVNALWAPKGVPKEIVDKIYKSYEKAYDENKEETDRIAKTGEQTVLILSGAELRKKYQEQYDFFEKTVGEMGWKKK